MNRRWPRLGIAVAILAVATAALFIRLSTSGPLVIAFWRMALATLILLPWWLRDPTPVRHLPILAVVGIILGAHFGLWITSLEYITVAASVVLVTAHPLFVAPISHFVLGDRLGRLGMAGVALGMVGLVVMFWGRTDLAAGETRGYLLAIGGGIAAGVYLLAGRRLRQRLGLMQYVVPVYAFAALGLILVLPFSGQQLFPTGSRTEIATGWLLFLALALIPNLAGHTLYNWTLRYVSATFVSVSLVAEPILASLLVLVILAEVPAGSEILGGVIALIGIVMVGLGEAATARPVRVTGESLPA